MSLQTKTPYTGLVPNPFLEIEEGSEKKSTSTSTPIAKAALKGMDDLINASPIQGKELTRYTPREAPSLQQKLQDFGVHTAAIAVLRQSPYPVTTLSAYFGLKKSDDGWIKGLSTAGAAAIILKMLPRVIPGPAIFPVVTISSAFQIVGEELEPFLPKDLDRVLYIDSEYGAITARQGKMILDMARIPADLLQEGMERIAAWLEKMIAEGSG